MKLKKGLITQNIDGTQFLIPAGDSMFHGIVRNNETAAFIVDCLKEDISLDTIVDRMCAEYNAPREVIQADAERILNTLRRINALEE